jgi:hypothetical protein
MTQARVQPRSDRILTIVPLLVLAAMCWGLVLWRMGGAAGGPGADPGPIGFPPMPDMTMSSSHMLERSQSIESSR